MVRKSEVGPPIPISRSNTAGLGHCCRSDDGACYIGTKNGLPSASSVVWEAASRARPRCRART
jgi:hypothetical protein